MAFDTFFIDPYGDVMPCNGTKEKKLWAILTSKAGTSFGQASKRIKCVQKCAGATEIAG